MTLNNFLALMVLIVLGGCATPEEVKTLSTKQLTYFDKSMEMVEIQSQALILASDKLATLATNNINAEQAEQEQGVVEDLIKPNNKLTKEDAEELLQSLASLKKDNDDSRAKVNKDLEAIKAKSAELKEYVATMKRLHLVLNAYIQSEKAGEAVLKATFNEDSVKGLVSDVDKYTKHVIDTTKELSGLIELFPSQ